MFKNLKGLDNNQLLEYRNRINDLAGVVSRGGLGGIAREQANITKEFAKRKLSIK